MMMANYGKQLLDKPIPQYLDILYFLEISPHLKILLPLKCCHMVQGQQQYNRVTGCDVTAHDIIHRDQYKILLSHGKIGCTKPHTQMCAILKP